MAWARRLCFALGTSHGTWCAGRRLGGLAGDDEPTQPRIGEEPLTDGTSLTPHGETVLLTVTVGTVVIVALAVWALVVIWKQTHPITRRPARRLRKVDVIAQQLNALQPADSEDSLRTMSARSVAESDDIEACSMAA